MKTQTVNNNKQFINNQTASNTCSAMSVIKHNLEMQSNILINKQTQNSKTTRSLLRNMLRYQHNSVPLTIHVKSAE